MRPHDVVIEWDEARAQAIIRALCWRERKLFSAYPELGHDDRVQLCLAHARAAWNAGGYNPWLGRNVSGWINRVCCHFLVSLSRQLASRHRQDRAAARPEAFVPGAVISRSYDRARPLEQWLADVVRAARVMFPPKRFRNGRKRFRLWQLVATAILMQRLRIGSTYVASLLGDRPELRKVLCFRQDMIPSDRHLREVARYVRRNLALEPDEVCRDQPTPEAA